MEVLVVGDLSDVVLTEPLEAEILDATFHSSLQRYGWKERVGTLAPNP